METVAPRAYRPLLAVECELPTFPDGTTATKWLDAEIANRLPAAHLAGACGQPAVWEPVRNPTFQAAWIAQ